MLEIKITIPGLAEAINNLAEAMTVRAKTTLPGVTNGAAPTSTTCAGVKQAESTPVVQAPVASEPQLPWSPDPAFTAPTAPTAPTTVPTSAPQYTLEMIAKAGTALVDAGKMAELSALLAKYGVEVLTALDPAHYGAFATELRALGATI